MTIQSIRQILFSEVSEYRRPWKLFTLFVGLSLLIWGARHFHAPDWDIPISIIMASLTYLTAPISVRILFKRKWSLLPLMLFLTWCSVDGCYWLYWSMRDPFALELMRRYNFTASLGLYWLCGIFWLYRGTLRNFFGDLQMLFRDLQNAKDEGA